MGNLAAMFGELEDPRRGNGIRHSLHDIPAIALCSVLCGGETCADMALVGRAKEAYLRGFLPLPNGIPSHDTFCRLLRALNPEAFHRWFVGLMNRLAQECSGVVAVDGKTLRRSYDRAEGTSPLHLVSAWAAEQRLVLGQLAVDGKSNEITAAPQLLELLSLRGMVVTADAMHCQRRVSRQVAVAEADYVLALKGNQGTLHEDVRLFLEDPATPVAQATQPNQGHGRVESRVASVSDDIGWLQETHQWPGLGAVGKITATRRCQGQTTVDTRYYLMSRAFEPERFNEIVRSHWDVENGLHWRLDLVFNEDQARNRKGHCAENMALLRKLALNLASLEPSPGSMRGKLKRAGWDDAFLTSLLSQFAKFRMR